MTDEINNDDIEVDINGDLTDLENKLDEVDRQATRAIVLSDIAENVEETQTVSVYDVARANEVDHGILDEAKDEEGNYQVTPALNALGKSNGFFGSVLKFIGIWVIMSTILSLMAKVLHGHLNKKLKRDYDQMSRDINNPKTKENSNPKPVKAVATANYDPNSDPEAIYLFNKIKKIWDKISGEYPDFEMQDYLSNPRGPWTIVSENKNRVTSTYFWDKGASKYADKLSEFIKSALSEFQSTIEDLSQRIEEASSAIVARKPLPDSLKKDFRRTITLRTIDQDKVSLDLAVKTINIEAPAYFPMNFPNSPISATAIRTRNKYANSGVYDDKLVFEVIQACKKSSSLNIMIGKDPVAIAKKTELLIESIKRNEGKLASALSGFSDSERQEYISVFRDITAISRALSDYLALLNKIITYNLKYSEISSQVVGGYLSYIENSNLLITRVREKMASAASKAAGNNSLAQSDQFVENIQSAVREGSADEADVNNIVAISEEEVSRLEAFVEELEANDGIDRSDVIQIEEAAPGLLSDVRQNYTFTFSRSKVGFDDTLATLRAEIERRSQINERLKSIH